MLTSTLHTVSDYVVEFLRITRLVENHILEPYYDRAPQSKPNAPFQNVTIGDGINIDWSNTTHLKLVLGRLGIVTSSDTVEANRRALAGESLESSTERTNRLDAMVTAFQQVMINNRPASGARLQDVSAANVILETQLDSLSALFGGPAFELSETQSEDVVRQILNGGVIPGFGGTFTGKETELDNILGQPGATKGVLAHHTREYVAMMSLYYNGGTRTVPPTGKLVTAIVNDNRAEAWFEIRYNTNSGALSATPPDNAKGLAKRRYFEAELFGLYDDAPSVTVAEAKEIYRMFTNHRDVIAKYEGRYGIAFDGSFGTELILGDTTTPLDDRPPLLAANNDFGLSGNDVVEAIRDALSPARDALIADIVAQNPSLASVDLSAAAGYLTVNILINPSTNPNSNAFLAAIEYDANGDERAVNNILIGGGGDDHLTGGKGDDILIGGDGHDRYIYNVGDGADRIIDSDKDGRIIVLGTSSGGAVHVNFSAGNFYQVAANIWTNASGDLTLTHNSPWRIEVNGGGTIELGEDLL